MDWFVVAIFRNGSEVGNRRGVSTQEATAYRWEWARVYEAWFSTGDSNGRADDVWETGICVRGS